MTTEERESDPVTMFRWITVMAVIWLVLLWAVVKYVFI